MEQLEEWQAYYRLEPFTREINKYHLAQIAAFLFNINRDPKTTRQRPILDFVLMEEKQEVMDPEANRRHVELILDNWIFGQNALVQAGLKPAE